MSTHNPRSKNELIGGLMAVLRSLCIYGTAIEGVVARLSVEGTLAVQSRKVTLPRCRGSVQLGVEADAARLRSGAEAPRAMQASRRHAG